MTHIWSLTNIFTKNVIRLDKPILRAGRNRNDDIVCCSNTVSRNHANFLINTDGLAHIQDNKSTNGTYVNNERIQPLILHQIKDGDQIGLGVFNNEQHIKQANSPHYIFEVTHCKMKMNATEDVIELLNDSEEDLVHSDESEVNNDEDKVTFPPKSVDLKNFGEVEFVSASESVNEVTNVNVDLITVENCSEVDKGIQESIQISEGVVVDADENNIVNILSNDFPEEDEPIIYSSIDQCSVIDISDEENEDLVCSQLSTSQLSSKKNDNKANNVDNLFSQIKKELEEMDQLKYVPNPVPIDLDSDNESDWLADLQLSKKENLVVEAAHCSLTENNEENNRMKRKTQENSDNIMCPAKKPKNSTTTTEQTQTVLLLPKKLSITENIDIVEQRRRRLKEIALKTAKKALIKKEHSEIQIKEAIPQASSKISDSCNIVPQVHTFDIILNILSWPTIWLEEQARNKDPPPIHKQPVRPMTNCFQNYDDYYRTIIPLLTYELWDSIFRDYAKATESFFKVRSTQLNINETQRYIQLECIKYLTKEEIDHGKYPKDGDLILIHIPTLFNDRIKYKKLFGYVTGTRRQNIFMCDREDPNYFISEDSKKKCLFTVIVKYLSDKLMLEKSFYICLITSITSHLRVFKSVKYLQYSPLCEMILKPQIKDYKLPKLLFKESLIKENLNATQKKIVSEAATICVRDEPGIYLIKGPPGTGKSTIIINIISKILLNKPIASSDTCILLVAPSNAAIDELTNRILFKVKPTLPGSQRRNFKLIRIGPKQMVHPNIKLYCLNELTKRNVLKEYLNKRKPTHMQYINKIVAIKDEIKSTKAKKDSYLYKELHMISEKYEDFIRSTSLSEYNMKLKSHESDILKGANIICSTLSSCLRLSLENSFGSLFNKKNMCVIVDEATQSQEPETLIPITLGINKIVLVGDPKQLPATTISWAAKKLGYGKSLFSRIEEQFKGVADNPIRMLTVQYRMHPVISEYPNMAFYENMLVNSFKQKKGMGKLKPYLILNVNGYINQNYYNEHEVKCVVNLLEAINTIIIDKNTEYSVGVITPYNNQKFAISNRIKSKRFKADIAVNTVDSFQGQEKDVIILSCVRSNTNDFLEDEKRLNVALTRAKSALYIVGTHSLFSQSIILGNLKQDAALRNLVISVTENATVSDLKALISCGTRRPRH